MTVRDEADGGPARPRRRQARGERRIAEILDAAARLFARVGYETATTNAIAAEAGISPGSLYQFFPNKKAIATELATRFAAEMAAAHREAFESVDFRTVDLRELVDRVVDPIVAFNLANPGFKALFARPDMPDDLGAAIAPIQVALVGRVEGMIATRAPELRADQRARSSRVMIQIFQAMVPLIVAGEPDERSALVVELKNLLASYLAPLLPPVTRK